MRKHLLLILSFLSILLSCPLFAQETDPDVLEFAFITDTHKWGPTADVRFADNNIKAFVQYCNEHPNIKFALHAGDFMNAYDTKHEQAIFCLEHGLRDFAGLHIPFYTTKGNHDCNGKQRINGKRDNSQIVTDHEYYQIFSPLSPKNPLHDSTGIVIDPVKPEGNYYYRDFPDHKFRLIVLNDYDLDSLEYFGYHGAQMKWLAEKALDFTDKAEPTDWCFLVMAHGFGFNMFAKPISRLLHAYTNGQDFEDEDRGYSYHCQYDKMPRAKLVALIGGHNHEDMYDCPDGYNILHVNRGFATGGEVGEPEQELCFDHFYLNVREKTLYEHRIGRGRDHTFRYDPGELISPMPTFPEAMGMGGFTHGGAKGREIWVTNLNDSGPGSLRWAVSQKGNRMVCFKVSGSILLKSPIIIDNDSLSICGHSAPDQGITIQGQSIQIKASDVIMRYLHLRSCELSDGDFGQSDLLIDHLSCSFTEGPAISIRRAKNVTVQNCLISHTRHDAIVAGGYMSTYYHNLITSCPNALHFPDNEGENRWIHIYRNVIDNWQDYAMYGGGRGGEITIEENYLTPGPATVNTKMLTVAPDGTGRYYTNGNAFTGQEYVRDQWGLVDDHLGLPYAPADDEVDFALREQMDPVARPIQGDFATTSLVIAAFHYRGLFTRPTKHQTWREAMLWAGCSLQRDSYDQALIEHLREGKTFGPGNGLFTDVKSLGGYPRIPKRSHEPKYNSLAQWLDNRAAADKSIVILFDNDIYNGFSNYPLLAGYRDAIQSDSCHVGIISTGNFLPIASENDPQAESLHHPSAKTVIEAMSLTNYDAIGLGQRELSYMLPELENVLKPTFYNITNCTIRKPNDNQRRAFKPYVLYNYGNRKVAYIGVSPLNGENRREQVIPIVQESINKARAEGADYVIVLAYLGDDNTRKISVSQLITGVTGVDVVLDGYPSDDIPTQIISDNAGHDVILCRPGKGFESIGQLIIAPDGLITTQLIPTKELRFKSRRITQLFDQLPK